MRGNILAIVMERDRPPRVSVKCEPEIAPVLRDEHAAVTGGFHLNKRHWNTISLDGTVPAERVREWIEGSWDLVVEKLPIRERRHLGWQADRGAA